MDKAQRTFIPGDSWVCYKIYTGEKTSDTILTEVLKPIAEKLLQHTYIDQWFFIRYSDPKNHLRVRYHCTDRKYVGEVIKHMYDGVSAFAKADFVYKIQIDTYHRELERYGAQHIQLAEKLFFAESEMIVQFLDHIDEEEQQLRWLFALRALDELLDQVHYTNNQKLTFMEGLKTGFGKEFGMNKALRKQIDTKFRTHKNTIQEFLNSTPETNQEYEFLRELLKKKRLASASIVKELIEKTDEQQLTNYLGSYAHMLMNRMFRSRNRLYELVLYSFLFQHYKILWGVEKFVSKKNTKEKI